MNIPDNVETFTGELGSYWFDETGILYSVSNNTRRTVENILSNVELVKRITNNRKACLVVYVAPSPVPDAATRKLVQKELPGIYKAMAIISKGGLGKFIMNFLFKLKPPSIPMKTFSDEEKAKAWIMQYLPDGDNA